jgi:hypothetical protein
MHPRMPFADFLSEFHGNFTCKRKGAGYLMGTLKNLQIPDSGLYDMLSVPGASSRGIQGIL